MAIQLTSEDARQSLASHAEIKGREIFEKYGPRIGWKELLRIVEDRTCVRYPCEVAFDASPLLAGELAFPRPMGETPEEGFQICIHPLLMTRMDEVPLVALYQFVLVNYGEFASTEDAEAFGAAALGLSTSEYYTALCELHDSLFGAEDAGGCGGTHSPCVN